MTRSSNLPTDSNQRAAAIVQLSTAEQPSISAYLSTIGRKGGLKGGKARAANLSAKRRRAIAKKAARARWKSG